MSQPICQGCQVIAANWLTTHPKEGDRATCPKCGVEKLVTRVKYKSVAVTEVKKKGTWRR